MATPLLICDDSNMARKQVARSLPEGWDVDITFATNGKEGLEAIREGKGEIVLLDLTMPVMDGYSVLEAVKSEGLNAMIIVISGDIQPDAHKRVTKLGAIDFIQKPINPEKLQEVLRKFGLI
jgi:two-component system, chemotaxis family, chemotaxis protein CheY